jgi:hypothetical protein
MARYAAILASDTASANVKYRISRAAAESKFLNDGVLIEVYCADGNKTRYQPDPSTLADFKQERRYRDNLGTWAGMLVPWLVGLALATSVALRMPVGPKGDSVDITRSCQAAC